MSSKVWTFFADNKTPAGGRITQFEADNPGVPVRHLDLSNVQPPVDPDTAYLEILENPEPQP